MTIEWRYVDSEGEWNAYDDGQGVENPTKSFVVRVIDDNGNVVSSRIVQVCGAQYSPFISFEVVDTETERKYLPILNGIPESEIDVIEWGVTEYTDETTIGFSGVVNFGGVKRDATGVYSVCVTAQVTFVCDCDNLDVDQTCYTFTEDANKCPEDLGLEMELEDGAWKPVRVGTIECCVALDIILWKINETDDWSILREPIETIYANTVWFKRVVAFNDNICPIFSVEINSDES